jgi:hypothetical protein
MSGRNQLGHSPDELNRIRQLHVEALNHALRDIPPDRLRMHLCWGNNVIAGTDCGFAHFATTNPKVDPRIAWAKLRAMAEGARLASLELW